MSHLFDFFNEIWFVDFEFKSTSGEKQEPVCMVALEFRSGKTIKIWFGDDPSGVADRPPFDISEASLFVSFYASAEFGCFLSLGWEMPKRILDLYVEFRNLTSGKKSFFGNGLLAALKYFGLPAMEGVEKDRLREMILTKTEFSEEEKLEIIEYCAADVVALKELFKVMAELIDLPRALLRGRYMTAVAVMEFSGVPIDQASLHKIRANWEDIKLELIRQVDKDFNCYVGTTFKTERFERLLASKQIQWPLLESGHLKLDDETFKEMANLYPELETLRQLRKTISQLRLSELPVGSDGRNRVLLSPFGSKTGRNQPSNSRFIFGPAAWMRSLIKPRSEFSIAYIDYSQQELALAASFSNDPRMLQAYESGDFYLSFAKMAGAAPKSATKETHTAIRDQYKTVSLGVLYGLSGEGIARKLGVPLYVGKHLLMKHQEVFRRFWTWSTEVQDCALLSQKVSTVFGWNYFLSEGSEINTRSLRNFPMQGNGAEILRLACCMGIEAGIKICCPVHDAVLIEAPTHEIDKKTEEMRSIMAEASRIVLGNLSLKTDYKIVHFPDRYMDPRGKGMWEKVSSLIGLEV
jgi:hypothetical protein